MAGKSKNLERKNWSLFDKRADAADMVRWVTMLSQLRFTYLLIHHPAAAPGNTQVALDWLIWREVGIEFGKRAADQAQPARHDNCTLIQTDWDVSRLFAALPDRFNTKREPARQGFPIILLSWADRGRVLLIDGRRRLNAARRQQQSRIECFVIEYMNRQ